MKKCTEHFLEEIIETAKDVDALLGLVSQPTYEELINVIHSFKRKAKEALRIEREDDELSRL